MSASAPMTTQIPARPGFDAIVRHFAPSWFAAVMGTGVLAVDCYRYGERWPALQAAGELLHWLNVVLFAALVVPWALRWVRHTGEALAALRNPVVTQFYPTIGVALVVLALQFLTYGGNLYAASALWIAGVVLILLFSVVVPLEIFRNEAMTLEQVTPGMFIPPVGLVVIPVVGNVLTAHADGMVKELLLVIDYLSLGTGAGLYVAVLALTFQRFVLGKRMPPPLVPTVWINLGPIGVIVLSLLGLAGVTPFLAVKEPFYVLALLLWGFGGWWLVIALAITAGELRRRALPFSLAWWAFTFPLGAYAAAGHRLGTLLGLEAVWLVGMVSFALLAVLWAAALFNTARGVWRGTVFLPHAPPGR